MKINFTSNQEMYLLETIEASDNIIDALFKETNLSESDYIKKRLIDVFNEIVYHELV